MPDSHLKSVEKVVDLAEAKNTATILHGDSANTTTILNDVGDSATSFLLGKNVMMSSAGNIPIEEKSLGMATDVDDLVPGGNEHETMEAPVLATSSSEISVPVKPSSEMTAPALTMPPHHASVSCPSFARYVAGFWLVRTALGITDSALCLFEIIAQTLGTPLLEPLNSLRRALRSVLDEPAESLSSVLDEPVESLASVLDDPVESLSNAKVSSNTDGPIATNNSPSAQVSGEVENDEDAKNPVHAMDDNKDAKNPVHAMDDNKDAKNPAHAMDDNEDAKKSKDATDEPIFNNEIRKSNMSIEGTEFEDNNKSGAKRNSSERDAGTGDAGLKTTKVKGPAGVLDFKESYTNSKNLKEFEEEIVRKSIAQAVKDVEPIKLKTYEKRVDDIVEVESTNIFNNFEEFDIEVIDTTDDFKTEDNTLDENSFDKDLSLDEPPPQSSFFQDQYYPLLLEHTFLGPPAPAPASAQRYPGFRHLFVYEPYQTRYGSLGPVEDLLDDLILGAVQLSSTRDDPADYPLPEDSFDSSFENNEF